MFTNGLPIHISRSVKQVFDSLLKRDELEVKALDTRLACRIMTFDIWHVE